MSVLRRPPVTALETPPKTARCKNVGADSETPILAKAIPPDLRKNLRFIYNLSRLLPLKLWCTEYQSHNLCKWIVDVCLHPGALSLQRAWFTQLVHLAIRVNARAWSWNTHNCLFIELLK